MSKSKLLIALILVMAVATVANAVPPKPADTLAEMRHEIRNEKNAIVTLETDLGNLVIELYRDVAPAHADSFLARVNDGFYSGTKFHRIIKKFMIQGGNPFLAGKPAVKYYLPNELSQLQHKFGTLSMASRGAPTTAQTQFFVCLGRNRSTTGLDNRYVVFGQLLQGFDVLHALGNTKVERSSKTGTEVSSPVEDVNLIKAYRSDAEGKPLK
jgi:cyclophilin family peptidyl-prolyl cis-trans isomerase